MNIYIAETECMIMVMMEFASIATIWRILTMEMIRVVLMKLTMTTIIQTIAIAILMTITNWRSPCAPCSNDHTANYSNGDPTYKMLTFRKKIASACVAHMLGQWSLSVRNVEAIQ